MLSSDSPVPLPKVTLLQLGDLELYKTTDSKPKLKKLSVTTLLTKLMLDHHLDLTFKLKVIHHLPTLIVMMTLFNKKITSQEIMDMLVTKEKFQFNSKQMQMIFS